LAEHAGQDSRVMTVLVIVEFAAFVWSFVLYFLAVWVSGRRQESGLLFSILGIIAFFFLYEDRLPSVGTSARDPLRILGASEGDLASQSPVWAAVAIAVLYTLRIAVYYELLVPHPDEPESVAVLSQAELGMEESILADANDIVAPALSYATFAASLGALLALMYGLNVWLGACFFAALVILYYATVLYRNLWALLRAVGQAIRLAAAEFWEVAQQGYLLIIVGLARAEMARRGDPSRQDLRVYEWATQRLGDLKTKRGSRRSAFRQQVRSVTKPPARKQRGSSSRSGRGSKGGAAP
jgi:hypothetical protein